jgi:hypothetical protein
MPVFLVAIMGKADIPGHHGMSAYDAKRTGKRGCLLSAIWVKGTCRLPAEMSILAPSVNF